MVFSFGDSWVRLRSAVNRLPEALTGVLPVSADAQPWQEMLPPVGVIGYCGLGQVGMEEVGSCPTLDSSEPELNDGGSCG